MGTEVFLINRITPSPGVPWCSKAPKYVPSHGTNRGSNPLRDANKINNLDDATQVISAATANPRS
jgi:hypothetical protein